MTHDEEERKMKACRVKGEINRLWSDCFSKIRWLAVSLAIQPTPKIQPNPGNAIIHFSPCRDSWESKKIGGRYMAPRSGDAMRE